MRIFLWQEIEVWKYKYNENTKIAFKNCTPFKTCRTEIYEAFVDEDDYIYIAMHMYNLIEYSDNYSDTSGSLWQFKRDEIENSCTIEILSNLEMLLINSKVELSLSWGENIYYLVVM